MAAEGPEHPPHVSLPQEDEVVLQCSATILKEQLKLCLAAEGFGNRLCFLESTSNAQNVPPDLAICCFILEQSLSVRALQEMLANTMEVGSEGVDLDKWVCANFTAVTPPLPKHPPPSPTCIRWGSHLLPLAAALENRAPPWELGCPNRTPAVSAGAPQGPFP
uniref:Inositol 1,4,5-trisphosphate/ryanodine receptor domain-containing protein n=1 Tax=Gopherus agassizii TaxID=38772 RepID=A0A452HM59_9SAUR